ncbi:MAG: SH3 domain-containing protein [Anaerolineae bacterium]|nr:SH3 domain-containing protein [Anaerolineae bacterium]
MTGALAVAATAARLAAPRRRPESARRLRRDRHLRGCPRPAAQRDVRSSGLYLPWWSLIIMVAVVGAVTLVLVLAFSALAEPKTPGDQVPRVQVITPQPTLSQDFLGGAGQGETDSQGLWPTPIARRSPHRPSRCRRRSPALRYPWQHHHWRAGQGGWGRGHGLNIRSAPGTGEASTPRFVAPEESVFVVVEGPQTADGLEWWRVEDPDDPQRYGWAARNYLEVISE